MIHYWVDEKPSLAAVMLIIIILILLPAFSCTLVSAACDFSSTPKIMSSKDYFELDEGKFFAYDFNLSNMPEDDVAYYLVDLSNKSLYATIDRKGVFSLYPGKEDTGYFLVGILAMKGTCADTFVIKVKVYAKPRITAYFPYIENNAMSQTDSMVLGINATDDEFNNSLSYSWLLDSLPTVSRMEFGADDKNRSFYFRPGYNLSGLHNITAKVTNPRNLSSEKNWFFEVVRINRPPVLRYQLPEYIAFLGTSDKAYGLNDYFSDPDGGRLSFGYRKVIPNNSENFRYADFDVEITGDGSVFYNPVSNRSGYAYYVFTATDLFNLSAESNTVRVDLMDIVLPRNLTIEGIRPYCGNFYCDEGENCSNCRADCGDCKEGTVKGCYPNWNCTAWSPCLPIGFQLRTCEDINNCGDNRTKPDVIKSCVYSARCDDGLKNGIEDGVDCGGPCDPCPNCSDSIMNQGEDGVDCGGPCDPCPNCFDNLKNQNETDIDCGGPCSPCEGNRSCLVSKDCKSLRCAYLVCAFANCTDGIKNQNEEGVDCGGPCEKVCGNCHDGLMNGGERGIDCGGKCKPCPNCTDMIKNQDERLTDCGGVCQRCTLHDYIFNYSLLFITGIMVMLIFVFSVPAYFSFILRRPDKARSLYDNNSFFKAMITLNRFFRPYRKLRRFKPIIGKEELELYKQAFIEEAKKPDLKSKELHSLLMKIFVSVFGLPESFDNSIFLVKVRQSNIPIFLRVLLVGLYKKIDILLVSTFIPSEKLNEFLVEIRFLVSELAKE